ncbi:MAG: phosphonoacetaldehyde reductase [Eubacterium sp.]|nr:phosphonoacetaldehyde reductase [Eubacterium sp.]
MSQQIISSSNQYESLDSWIKSNNIRKLFLVCDSSLKFLKNISEKLDSMEKDSEYKLEIIRFDDFQPNPLYDSVVKGVRLYRESGCNAIMAIGGGSAMDVAKCIKLYSNMDSDGSDGAFLNIPIVANDVPFLAMPTTAGTGSEATRFAVVYYDGKKQSVADISAIPSTVLMDSSVLVTLPEYQKKSTMMDAFCHSIESFWSVNSTEESKTYSRQAIRLIIDNLDGYLGNTEEGNKNMLIAANLAGKAINITQTTAGHAMCYKLTSLYGTAHGHSAILCDRVLLPWMLENTDKCIDSRGEDYLRSVFHEIAEAMGCDTPEAAADKVEEIFKRLELDIPTAKEEDYAVLKTSVNPVRLKNHPIALDEETIDMLYHRILK